MKIKKFIGVVLSILLVGCNSVAAFAEENHGYEGEEAATIEVNFNEIDINKPYETSCEFVNDNGEQVTLRLVYTPEKEHNSMLRWSKEYDAKVGGWKAYYDGITTEMSYEFDMSKSGSHWKVSNARNHIASAALSSIKNKKLVVNRAISTKTYPAEIMGSCDVEILDTAIGHLMTVNAWIKTTVSDSGIVKISGN